MELIYINLYYNKHASQNNKFFCKNFNSGDEAVEAGNLTPGFIATFQLPKKDIEEYEKLQDDTIC